MGDAVLCVSEITMVPKDTLPGLLCSLESSRETEGEG